MRRRRRQPVKGRRIVAVTGVLLAGVCSVRLLVAAAPSIGSMLYQMTLLSAAMTVPEGAIDLAKERFAQELVDNDNTAEEETESQPDPTPPPESSPESSSSQASSSAGDIVTPPAPPIEEIPEESRGVLASAHYTAGGGNVYIPIGSAFLKNATKLSREAVMEQLAKPSEMKTANTTEPQVLIMHTHATESYAPYDAEFYDKRNASWRNRDNEKNVVKLGDIITQELNDAGIVTLHDATQHDYPSYNGSYQRSEKTVQEYLTKYPSIKVVIDVHRDAIQKSDGTVYKAVADVDGKKTAQVMIIAGCDDGTMGMPNWDQNLRFASALQQNMESAYPGMTRPILFDYRKYNQNLTQGSLLLEFGSHGNTLEECGYTAHNVGKSLAKTLKDCMQ